MHPAVLALLQGLELRGRSAMARECYQTTVRYLTNHLPRILPHLSREGLADGERAGGIGLQAGRGAASQKEPACAGGKTEPKPCVASGPCS